MIWILIGICAGLIVLLGQQRTGFAGLGPRRWRSWAPHRRGPSVEVTTIASKVVCLRDVIIREDGLRLRVVETKHTGCYPTKLLVHPEDMLDVSPGLATTWLSFGVDERLRVERCVG